MVKVLLAVLATFFCWVVLSIVWIAVLGMMVSAKTRAANLPPSSGHTALDTSTVLFQVLFRSPWYWAAVAVLLAAGVVFARRWALS